jgi:hypothetical protein
METTRDGQLLDYTVHEFEEGMMEFVAWDSSQRSQ